MAPSSDVFYNYENYSYHAPYDKISDEDTTGGHAVSIVGWDDNYSKDNFNIKPEHDGAFIILNSWGEGFGDKGYFYMSYEDVNQIVGVIETDDVKEYNEYSNSYNFNDSNGWSAPNEENIFGIKFETESVGEYIDHIVIGVRNLIYPGEQVCMSSISTETGEEVKECFNHDVAKIKVYLNPKDDSFDKDKLIYLGETSSIVSTADSSIIIEKPIKIEGNKFSLVFETSGEYNDMTYIVALDKDRNEITDNFYGTTSLDGEWNVMPNAFPVHVYTIKEVEPQEKPVEKNNYAWIFLAVPVLLVIILLIVILKRRKIKKES